MILLRIDDHGLLVHQLAWWRPFSRDMHVALQSKRVDWLSDIFIQSESSNIPRVFRGSPDNPVKTSSFAYTSFALDCIRVHRWGPASTADIDLWWRYICTYQAAHRTLVENSNPECVSISTRVAPRTTHEFYRGLMTHLWVERPDLKFSDTSCDILSCRVIRWQTCTTIWKII